MPKTIYDDIPGLDASLMALKAALVLRLEQILTERRWDTIHAAQMLCVPEEQLALVRDGRFRDIEPELLLLWLRKLGYHVSIELTAPGTEAVGPGALRVKPNLS